MSDFGKPGANRDDIGDDTWPVSILSNKWIHQSRGAQPAAITATCTLQ